MSQTPASEAANFSNSPAAQARRRRTFAIISHPDAGKTTLTRILAGEALPAAGKVMRTGEIGYLPQDPRTEDPSVLALHRVLSARGLDEALRRLREAEAEMAADDAVRRDKAMRKYERADAALHAAGGYAAEAEARQIAKNAGVPTVPGSEEPLKDPEEAVMLAEEIGFPVIFKAAAGGGGRGMRIVRGRSGASRPDAWITSSTGRQNG